MTFKEIKELIELFDESNLTKMSIKENEFKIELDKNATAVTTSVVAPSAPQPQIEDVSQATTPSASQTPQAPAEVSGDFITSPMVGTFYQAPSPESPAYVKVGDKVKAGQTVCIVEAMKIMNEIQAEYDCEILEILVADGQAVEFDTPLFKVKRV